MCHAASKAGSYHFCSVSCENEAERKGPMILEVPVGHVTFNDGTVLEQHAKYNV